MTSPLFRTVALLGAILGLMAVLLGAVVLILIYFASDAQIAQIPPLAEVPLPPAWLGWACLLAGFLSYVWGQGMLRQTDWSPFFAAVYLFHVGLYGSLSIWLLLSSPDTQPLIGASETLRPWLSSPAVQVLIVIAPMVVSFMLASALLRSRGIIEPYEVKYATLNTVRPVCPNSECRRLLKSRNGICERCHPREILAVLIPAKETDDNLTYSMRFRPGREEWRLSRRLDDVAPEIQTIYFNKVRSNFYGTVSAPHAKIEYRVRKVDRVAGDAGEQKDQNPEVVGEFYIVDLKSTNRTYVNGFPVSSDGVLLQDEDEIGLGDATFTFAVRVPDVTVNAGLNGSS